MTGERRRPARDGEARETDGECGSGGGRVRRLDPSTVDRIAAGEVVTRPARVAAELAGHGDPTPVDPGARGGRAADPDGDEPLVVTVYWDSGERYVSTGLFDSD